jgi:predicted dehydrogenase
MSGITRRHFIQSTVTAAAGVGLLSALPRSVRAQPMGANGDIRVAVIGLRGKGKSHIGAFKGMPGVRLVALCDIDPDVLNSAVQKLKNEDGIDVFATDDFRRIIERDDVDAISVAAPNHWHAPMAIMACQAGKDAYIEKPVSHNVWEGRAMVDAAKKYNRIVQAGTQTRSDISAPVAIEYVRSGKLGKIKYIYAHWFKNRSSIGNRHPWYPANVNYDLFCGPAPCVPLRRDDLHYDWHWMWDTGNGDISNLGTHMVDLSRWFAGFPTQPPDILSFGGRYGVNDCGDTPNTQLTILNYPDYPIMVEIRNLPTAPGQRSMDPVRKTHEGVIVQCENGYYAGYQGGAVYDNDGNIVERIPGDGGGTHFQNFIDAVRSRKTDDLRAPIEVGHVSTSTLLLGNISVRCGKPADVETIAKAVGDNEMGQERLADIKQHLAVHGIDLARQPLTLGGRIAFDAATETIASIDGETSGDRLDMARYQLKGTYRPPFDIASET